MPRTKRKPTPAVNDPADEVLTLSEAAALLRLSEGKVVRLVHTQGLPGRRIGSEWRFLKAAIQDWPRDLMSLDDEAFLLEIIEHPDDDSPRLVYADWLEEHGQPDRAEFIRVQCMKEKMAKDDPLYEELRKREYELFAKHGQIWREPLDDLELYPEPEFRRGFVWGLSLEPALFLSRAEDIFCRTPLQRIEFLVGETADLKTLAQSPWLRRLTSLRLRWDEVGPENVRILTASPYLDNLEVLDLYDNRIRSGGLRAIAKSPHLGRLRELVLGWNGITSLGLRALAASPLLGHLTHLDLFYNSVDDRGAAALASSPHATRLTHLCLRGNIIENVGGRALAESPYLMNLHSLDLNQNFITEEVRELLRQRFGNRVHF